MITGIIRLGFVAVLLCLVTARPLTAGPILLSVETVTPTVSAGGTAHFDVYLRGYDLPNSVVSFALNVGGSDPLLTADNTDFSSFMFTLNPALMGVIGSLDFDADLSDDGR